MSCILKSQIKLFHTSKTLSVFESAGAFEFLNVKKMFKSAFPSSSSNTICSVASAASAAAAAASLSFRASSIKLCRLPMNLWDCYRKKRNLSCILWFNLSCKTQRRTTPETGICLSFLTFWMALSVFDGSALHLQMRIGTAMHSR